MPRTNCLLCAALALTFTAARADTVIMKTGQLMEATELSRDDKSVEFEVKFGTMRVPLDHILRIEKDTPEKIAAREKQEEADLELAEKMKEEGKVIYKGKWITEQEKKKEEEKAAAEKKKKDEARLAAKKKAEEESKRKKQEEEKRLADLQRQQQTQQNQFEDERAQRYMARHGGTDAYNENRYDNNDDRDVNRNRNKMNRYMNNNNSTRSGGGILNGNFDQMIRNNGR